MLVVPDSKFVLCYRMTLDSTRVHAEWATLHSAAICVVMLAVAKATKERGRQDPVRCVRYFSA